MTGAVPTSVTHCCVFSDVPSELPGLGLVRSHAPVYSANRLEPGAGRGGDKEEGCVAQILGLLKCHFVIWYIKKWPLEKGPP